MADDARALAVAGRFNDAHRRLAHYNGIGRRMLDGRQIAILAQATTGHLDQALALLDDTALGERHHRLPDPALSPQPRARVPSKRRPDIIVGSSWLPTVRWSPPHPAWPFHCRLGLSIIDALGDVNHSAAQPIAAGLIDHTAAGSDGYAARDLLTHPGCTSIATTAQKQQLTAVVERCGLDSRILPEAMMRDLSTALDTAEDLITSNGASDHGVTSSHGRHS